MVHEGETIDQALVLYFKGPHSFTGEDCAEFHIHGSRAVLDRLYSIFRSMGLRHAEAGEFSRRAFENGKLDLTQAEAISDLVEAESEAQRQQALMQLDGGFRERYGQWRDSLIKLLAHIESIVDFPDEDIPESLSDKIVADIIALKSDIASAIDESKRGRQIREGYRIAIMGKPNAGKSSLFNALLGNDTAIVTPIAGTTRDVIESHIRIGNYTALIYDTAGLRETDDVVESEGIRRAKARGDTADLRLWVIDSSEPQAADLSGIRAGDYVVLNKSDRAKAEKIEAVKALIPTDTHLFETSLLTDTGTEALRMALEQHLEKALSLNTFPAATRERHMERLREAEACFDRALGIGFGTPELMAEDIRQALSAFDALFGRTDVEQVLDHIFSSFCIGK
ncbi:hypothetical protein AEYBE204_00930 [Asticcacaulis sp. YBE204]|nr:hypothetical protein AEYBE204_00930 [Asticcacaulis sp. YBE204]